MSLPRLSTVQSADSHRVVATTVNQLSKTVDQSTVFLNVKTLGAKGDSDATGAAGTDDTAAIQAGLDYLNSGDGGTLYVPEGFYRLSAPLTGYPRVRLVGGGMAATYLISSHAGGGGANAGANVANGSGIRTSSTLNGSTATYFEIRDLCIKNTNSANVGAGYYDTASSEIAIQRVAFAGFKYGVVLEQSELVDIDLCEFSAQLGGGAGVWIVNAADLTPGAAGYFTNRIAVKRCQINEPSTTYGVLDEGGYVHVLEDNNYNGCLNHVRVAGAYPLSIRGGEFEGAASHCILATNITLGGTSVGGPNTAIHGGLYSASTGHATIDGSGGGGLLQVDGIPLMSNGGRGPSGGCITGCSSFAGIWLMSYSINGAGVARDGEAQFITFDFAGPGAGLSIPGQFYVGSNGLTVPSATISGTATAKKVNPSDLTVGATEPITVSSDYSGASEHTIAFRNQLGNLVGRMAHGYDGTVTYMALGHFYSNGGGFQTTDTLRVDPNGITIRPAASVTPANNGDMIFEATSNTTGKIKYKGSDGVVRSFSFTLA